MISFFVCFAAGAALYSGVRFMWVGILYRSPLCVFGGAVFVFSWFITCMTAHADTCHYVKPQKDTLLKVCPSETCVVTAEECPTCPGVVACSPTVVCPPVICPECPAIPECPDCPGIPGCEPDTGPYCDTGPYWRAHWEACKQTVDQLGALQGVTERTLSACERRVKRYQRRCK